MTTPSGSDRIVHGDSAPGHASKQTIGSEEIPQQQWTGDGGFDSSGTTTKLVETDSNHSNDRKGRQDNLESNTSLIEQEDPDVWHKIARTVREDKNLLSF